MLQKNKTQFHRLIRNLRAASQEFQLEPDLVIGRALAIWCNERFPGLSPSNLPTILWSRDIDPNGNLRFTGEQKMNNEHCFVNMRKKDHPSVVQRP